MSTGIPRNRVVAIRTRRGDGRVVTGTGYLIRANLVLTACHCIADSPASAPAPSDGEDHRVGEPGAEPSDVNGVVGSGPTALQPVAPERVTVVAEGGRRLGVSRVTASPAVDMAALHLGEALPGLDDQECVNWARVDRNASGELAGCETVGYPRWQVDPQDNSLNLAEVRGPIRALDDSTSDQGYLVLRDPLLQSVDPPSSVPEEDRKSKWGGLSGALVFHRDNALGVVVQHHPRQGDSAIRVATFDRIAAADPTTADLAAALGMPAPHALPWVFPDVRGGTARARRRARRLAPPGERLADRQGVLEDLAAVGVDPSDTWRWVVGDAFSGKTALLAWFAVHPPEAAAVVSVFLRANESSNTPEYVLDELLDQLAGLGWRVDFQPPAHPAAKSDDLEDLLEAAAAVCQRRSQRLVLVIDGLDEYDSSRLGMTRWLPSALPADCALIASSRLHSPVDLGLRHPLQANVIPIPPIQTSDEIRALAHADIRRTLDTVGTAAQCMIVLLAVVNGGLSTAELRELLQRSGFQLVGDDVERIAGGELRRIVVRSEPDAVRGRLWVLAHDTFAGLALGTISAESQLEHRRVVDRWEQDYREQGWPADTPGFLLHAYTGSLAALATDRERPAADRRRVLDVLSTTLTSPGRWTAIFLATGTPVAADRELIVGMTAVADCGDEGILPAAERDLRLAQLGLHRRRGVSGTVTPVAYPVTAVWAMTGALPHAIELATAVLEPDGRAVARCEVALACAASGDDDAFDAALPVALGAIPGAGAYADSVRGSFVRRLAALGYHDAADRVGAGFADDRERVPHLAVVALSAALAGRAELAGGLIDQVVEIASTSEVRGSYRAVATAAEAAAALGDGAHAERLIALAESLTQQGLGQEWKYRHWAEQVVRTSSLRAQIFGLATEVDDPGDPRLADLISSVENATTGYGSDGWDLAAVAAALARIGKLARANELARRAVTLNLRNASAKWDGATFRETTPRDLAEMLLDAGLVDPVTWALDQAATEQFASLDQDSLSSNSDRLRLRSARRLAAGGRIADATVQASAITNARIGQQARGWIAAELCYWGRTGGEWTDSLGADSRATASAVLHEAVAWETAQRREKVITAITARLAENDSDIGADSLVDADALVDTVTAMANEPADPDEQSVDRSERTLGIARLVLRLASFDPVAAAAWIPHLDGSVRACLAESGEGMWWDPESSFAAGETTVLALARMHRPDQAADLAEHMVGVLAAVANAESMAKALDSTISALAAADRFTAEMGEQLIARARSMDAERSWSLPWEGAVGVAAAFAGYGGPATERLAEVAVDLIREQLELVVGQTRSYTYPRWYRAGIEVLRALMTSNRRSHASAVAELLLTASADPNLTWYDRSAILGGLVRSGEPTVAAEAMRAFLFSEGLSEHAADLPVDLLRQLQASGELSDVM